MAHDTFVITLCESLLYIIDYQVSMQRLDDVYARVTDSYYKVSEASIFVLHTPVERGAFL